MDTFCYCCTCMRQTMQDITWSTSVIPATSNALKLCWVVESSPLLPLPTTQCTAVPPYPPATLPRPAHQVLTFYCTRRSEAYEPIMCALVGPLFSMGLDPPAVSAMLNPLVGSLTLFLGRGLTHAVRDLAWAHAHRRLHDLCTYHDPELVQHLNR